MMSNERVSCFSGIKLTLFVRLLSFVVALISAGAELLMFYELFMKGRPEFKDINAWSLVGFLSIAYMVWLFGYCSLKGATPHSIIPFVKVNKKE